MPIRPPNRSTASQQPSRRRPISLSAEQLIKADELQPGQALPLQIQPAGAELNLLAWAEHNAEFIRSSLLKHGGILFRNFDVPGVTEFEQVIETLSAAPLEYRERSSPRHNVSDKIYTSTDYPADQSIFLHNENSYQHTWPLKIFFFCETPAQRGGETLIADGRQVYARLAPQLRERFRQKRVMYVRNFRPGLGLPWQTVFQTRDRAAVEEYCARASIKTEWRAGDSLRTRQVRPAVLRHPQTGEAVWFNHAAFFHVSTLAPALRKELLANFKEDELPSNTYYGDGSPIEPAVLDDIRAAYWQEVVPVAWQQGDVLLLDNMLAAHGRAPFAGSRKILVGMAEPCSHADVDDQEAEAEL